MSDPVVMDSNGARVNRLPNIFPSLGPVTRSVLFADYLAEDVTLTPEEWQAESNALIQHGLAGVAVRAIKQYSLPISADTYEVLQYAEFNEVATSARIVKASVEGLHAISAANIPFVITKGPGIALAGPRISDRPYCDLDVVVEPNHFAEARVTLARHGYTEDSRSVQAWDSFNRYCREAVNLRSPNGGSIDLHHRVSPWRWSGGLSFDVLRSGVRTERVFGESLPLASTVHNLLISALHVVSDKSRPGQTLRIWRDVLVLANSCSADETVEAATASGMVGWLQWILSCLPIDVRPVDLIDSLERVGGGIENVFQLRMLLPPRFGSRHLFGQVFRLPTLNAVLFTSGMIVPSPSYLSNRYPTNGNRYFKWWRDLLSLYGEESRLSHRLDSGG